MRDALKTVGDVVAGTATGLAWLVVVVPFAWARRAVALVAGRKPAVVWGPVPIVNIVYSVRADRLFGYRSESVVLDVYAINVRDRYDHAFERARRVPVIGRLTPFAVFLWAGLRFDVYGFFFDGGFLQGTPFWRAELALLRLAGKAIVVYPYGGDARLASKTRKLGRWNAYTDVSPHEEDRNEEAVRAHLTAFGRWANEVLGCADLVLDLPRLDGVFRYPFDVANTTPSPEEDDGVVTVVHAPNHRRYKGTRYLIDVIERLRDEGLPVELQLVEGVSNDEAMEIYRRADVIADQFLIGAYAVFAIEAMALGKPVVCYLNDRFRPFHPEWEECPIASANPDELEDVLRRLVGDAELRRDLGARGPAYVDAHHSLRSVGAAMDAVYRRVWP